MAQENRPPIPEAMRRRVRQRCGHGCVICGIPLVEIDHMEPYAQVREHAEHNLCALCPQHHDEKTKGLLPLATLQRFNAHPLNTRTGQSSPYLLHYEADRITFDLGTNLIIYDLPPFTNPLPALEIGGELVLGFTYDGGDLFIELDLEDETGAKVVRITENELVFKADAWDVVFEGRRLIVRIAPGDILLSVRFDVPDRVTIDRAKIYRHGNKIEVFPNRMQIGGLTLSGSKFANNRAGGITVGHKPG